MTKKNRKNMVAYIRNSQMDDAAREWAEENGVRLGVEFDVENLIWDEL